MVSKQTVGVRKTWMDTAETAAPVSMLEKLKNFLNSAIPEGYEDENGFHFGAKTARQPSSLPPAS